jgi:hypothetical protein
VQQAREREDRIRVGRKGCRREREKRERDRTRERGVVVVVVVVVASVGSVIAAREIVVRAVSTTTISTCGHRPTS